MLSKAFILKMFLLSLMIPACNTQKQIENLFAEADQLFSEKKYELAIDKYSEIIRRMPNAERAYFNRGKCYFNLTRYQDAVADYNYILKSKKPPEGISYKINRDSPLLDFEEKLVVYYDEAIFERAIAKLASDSLQGSLADFRSAMQSGYQPQSECYKWIGVIYFQAGMEKEGCEFVEKAYQAGDLNVRHEFRKECF